MKNIFISTIFLSRILFPNNSIAQNLDLVCKGQTTSVSDYGITQKETVQTYYFLNGKLYGIYIAQWTESRITIEFPKDIDFGQSQLLSRSVFIDRVSGNVFDIHDAIMSNPVYGRVKVRGTFEGVCEQGKKKF
jgi:hypothetical protein